MIRLYGRWLHAAALAMASLILTGCASTPEEPSGGILVRAGQKLVVHPDGTMVMQDREAVIPSDPEARAKLEADRADRAEAEERKETAVLLAKRQGWVKDPSSQPFLHWLCALTDDTVKYREEGKYGIVPKRNPTMDANAERRGLAVYDCSTIASSGATE
jgi:hypothetical protein